MTSGAGLLVFGLAAGLSFATVSCGSVGDDGSGDSVNDGDDDADASTYAGPDTFDSWPGTTQTESDSYTSTQGSVSNDDTNADGVTYAGPDETSSAYESSSSDGSGTDADTDVDTDASTSGTTGAGTDTDATGSTGTGSTGATEDTGAG